MVDPVAIWGAVTGTAGLGITLYREAWNRKRELRVERGWQYVYQQQEDGTKALRDVWVYVMAWNTGRRSLHIEHVGWDFLIEAPPDMAAEARDEQGVDDDAPVALPVRVEIALNGETFEAIPDGPSVKLWTRLPPILAIGVNPALTPVLPYVVTVRDEYWYGPPGPFLPEPPHAVDAMEAAQQLDALVSEYKASGTSTAVTGPRSQVHGVPRLVVEGDVQRAGDLLRQEAEGGSTGEKGE